MPAPQTVIQAALSRLSARLGSGLLDVAAQAAVLLQDAPERLRQELSLFWDEVEQEAERLERDAAAPEGSAGTPAADAAWGPSAHQARPRVDLQDQIDALRAQVAAFSRRLDQAP
jgi:hypothetical protein